MTDPPRPIDADSASPGDDASLAGVSYAEAIAELERLLGDLAADEADIDQLAAKVKRAAVLIHLCRARVDDARVDVERIVADVDADRS